jgi:hypothetical protein
MEKEILVGVLLFISVMVLFLLSRSIYTLEHTAVEIEFSNGSENCSPEVFVRPKRLGIENVISSCVVQREPFYANCTATKLYGISKLDHVCLNGSGTWHLDLYAKHTLFRVPKIELENRTL